MQNINPLAAELNRRICTTTPTVYTLLSDLGKRIYLPKGILSQSAEASEKAHRINATRAVAMADRQLLHLNVSQHIGTRLFLQRMYTDIRLYSVTKNYVYFGKNTSSFKKPVT